MSCFPLESVVVDDDSGKRYQRAYIWFPSGGNLPHPSLTLRQTYVPPKIC